MTEKLFETALGIGAPWQVSATDFNPQALIQSAVTHRSDPVLLASMFDLTPAETRVALELMAGTDVPGIADAHGVPVSTIRTRIESLLTRTETHRRAELVQLLLTATTF